MISIGENLVLTVFALSFDIGPDRERTHRNSLASWAILSQNASILDAPRSCTFATFMAKICYMNQNCLFIKIMDVGRFGSQFLKNFEEKLTIASNDIYSR